MHDFRFSIHHYQIYQRQTIFFDLFRSKKRFTTPLRSAYASLEGCKSFHKPFARLGYDNSTLNKPYRIICGVMGMLHH
jgi:hypothetical protein